MNELLGIVPSGNQLSSTWLLLFLVVPLSTGAARFLGAALPPWEGGEREEGRRRGRRREGGEWGKENKRYHHEIILTLFTVVHTKCIMNISRHTPDIIRTYIKNLKETNTQPLLTIAPSPILHFSPQYSRFSIKFFLNLNNIDSSIKDSISELIAIL